MADGFDLLILFSKSNIYFLCELDGLSKQSERAVKGFFSLCPKRYLSAET
jgi:hypothetical protein